MATLKTRTDYICIAAEMAELPTVGVEPRMHRGEANCDD
jgi:hypothetical protein